MAPTDAIMLTNYFPTPSSVSVARRFNSLRHRHERSSRNSHGLYVRGNAEILRHRCHGQENRKRHYRRVAAVGFPAVSSLNRMPAGNITNITTRAGYHHASTGWIHPYLFDGSSWTAITAISYPRPLPASPPRRCWPIFGYSSTVFGLRRRIPSRLGICRRNPLVAPHRNLT